MGEVFEKCICLEFIFVNSLVRCLEMEMWECVVGFCYVVNFVVFFYCVVMVFGCFGEFIC